MTQVKCNRDGHFWGEYVTEGASYTVTPPETKRGQYHFRNNRTGGGTFMQPWAYKRAMTAGWLTEEA
jgi:hypothetical protein